MDESVKKALIIAGGEKWMLSSVCQILAQHFRCETITPSTVFDAPVAVLVLDATLVAAQPVSVWRQRFPTSVFVAEEHVSGEVDFWVPIGMPHKILLNIIQQACRYWMIEHQARLAETALKAEHQQILQLTNIGIALSAEKDTDRLLAMILKEGSRLANCDAASLYLLDKSQVNHPQLIFKLTFNHSIVFPFEEKTMPLDKKSLAGYVAATGEVINIEDAYELPATAPYTLNKWFDENMGYRTRSMLVIPMTNYRGEVIGALQFINRKRNYETKLTNIDIVDQEVIPFDDKVIDLLRALAGQAAVSIENDMLLERINILFDGFVRASVHAIEQRDPTTSGHSFRVADLTTYLAMALPRSNKPRFKNINFSDNEIREIRFASLLHDFGKVGVREHVLVKEKKLPSHRLELIRYRVALEKERLRRVAAEKEVQILNSSMIAEEELEQRASRLREQLDQLDHFLSVIVKANEPTILAEEASDTLNEIHAYHYDDLDQQPSRLINQEELLALSVKKGSLTQAERKEIESHVVHTLKFLSLIPWTPELSRIPTIAGSHHEKLNGSGYPDGLSSEQIPLPSKLMTISDIYDALTASDRPYKPAVPLEKALNILEIESKAGLLDAEAVEVFIEAKIYDVIVGKDYRDGLSYDHMPRYAHHVCDMDVHSH